MANTNVGIRVVVLGAAEAHRQVGALRNDLTRFAATMDAASAGSAAFGRSLFALAMQWYPSVVL